MRHVDHEIGANLVGDLAEALEVDGARIGRAAGDDHRRLVLARELLDLVIVDEMVVGPDAILDGIEPLAREVRRRAVGEMAAGGEAQAHDGVAGLQQGEHDGLVRLAARMRLHIGEGAVEQALGAIDGELLDHVDILATAVIALAGIALGIFVGEQRAGGIEHGLGDDVLRGDQLDLVLLALGLVLDRAPDFGIRVLQMPGEKAASARLGTPRITCRHGYRSLSSTFVPPRRRARSSFATARGTPLTVWLALPHVVRARQQHPRLGT